MSLAGRPAAAAHTESILGMFWALWLKHGMCDCEQLMLRLYRIPRRPYSSYTTGLRCCLGNSEMKIAKRQRPMFGFGRKMFLVHLIVNARFSTCHSHKSKQTLSPQDFIHQMKLKISKSNAAVVSECYNFCKKHKYVSN